MGNGVWGMGYGQASADCRLPGHVMVLYSTLDVCVCVCSEAGVGQILIVYNIYPGGWRWVYTGGGRLAISGERKWVLDKAIRRVFEGRAGCDVIIKGDKELNVQD